MSEISQRVYRQRLQAIRGYRDGLTADVEQIAREAIHDYHFLNYRVSDFWTCDASPVGMCVFTLEERNGRLVEDVCRYCAQPVERK